MIALFVKLRGEVQGSKYLNSSKASGAAANRQPGCVIYRHMADMFDPTVAYIFEVWQTPEHLEAHALADYHQERVKQLSQMDIVLEYIQTYDLIERDFSPALQEEMHFLGSKLALQSTPPAISSDRSEFHQ
jgi:quinol monooxygenase YgiN